MTQGNTDRRHRLCAVLMQEKYPPVMAQILQQSSTAGQKQILDLGCGSNCAW